MSTSFLKLGLIVELFAKWQDFAASDLNCGAQATDTELVQIQSLRRCSRLFQEQQVLFELWCIDRIEASSEGTKPTNHALVMDTLLLVVPLEGNTTISKRFISGQALSMA